MVTHRLFYLFSKLKFRLAEFWFFVWNFERRSMAWTDRRNRARWIMYYVVSDVPRGLFLLN
jgi:hypothetical protein